MRFVPRITFMGLGQGVSVTRTLAITAVASLLTSLIPAAVSAAPPGTFKELQPLDDQGTVCSFYESLSKTPKRKGKVEAPTIVTYVSTIDGSRLFNKPYWTSSTVATKIADLRKQITKLKRSASKASAGKLKKLVAQREAFTAIRLQIKQCASDYGQPTKSKTIQFSHIKKVVDKQCMVCHQALGWQNTEEFFVGSGRVGASRETSPLYRRLKSNPEQYQPGDMPQTAPLAADQIYAIGRYISDRAFTVPPTPTPQPGQSDLEKGRDLIKAAGCNSCHAPGGTLAGALTNRSAEEIAAAIASEAQMKSLSYLSADQIRLIALALRIENKEPDPTPTPGPSPTPGDNPDIAKGRALLQANGCQTGCHVAGGPGGSTLNKSAADITAAIRDVAQMRVFSYLTPEEIRLMALALSVKTGGPRDESASVVVGTSPFVSSVFERIFLPDDPTTYNSVDQQIKTKISSGVFSNGRAGQFGGLCSRRFDTSPNCVTEMYTGSIQPLHNGIRAALLSRLYDDILSGTTRARAVQNLLQKIGLAPTAPIDAAAVQDLYALIFSGRLLPEPTALAFANTAMGMSSFSLTDRWAYLIDLIGNSSIQEAF